MIGNWHEYDKDEPTRFFDLSSAYLRASQDVCKRFQSDINEQTWPNAKVAMMLSNHATELFLKAALLKKNVVMSGHNIDALFARYCDVFPNSEFYFDCPFVSEYLGFTDEELEKVKNEKRPTESVIHRYPVDKPGTEWAGVHGFDVEVFLPLVKALEITFNTLRMKLNSA